MTAAVLQRVIAAEVHGVVTVPMGLEYLLTDPVAIRITLGDRWWVARSTLAAGLASAPAVPDGGASSVFVMRPAGCPQVAVGLRAAGRRWLVTVAADDLARFLAATYQVCPLEREQLLVSKELDMQCGFFHMIHGGGDPE